MIVCPCDELVHPPLPRIPPGLTSLPRQAAGYPDYLRALLRDAGAEIALAPWRARAGDDLGLMLLGMAAYLDDVLGFYDERIADESYLRTAVRRASLRELVALLGYRPRPAIAARAVIAVTLDLGKRVVIPAGTAFRSGPVPDGPPQVFEVEAPTTSDALRNEWKLGPKLGAAGDRLLLEAATARLTRDQLVLVRWPTALPTATTTSSIERVRALAISTVGRESELATVDRALAAAVVAVRPVRGRDGTTYIDLDTRPPIELPASLDPDEITLASPSLRAAVTSFFPADGGTAVRADHGGTSIHLDAIYKAIHQGDLVVVADRDDRMVGYVTRTVERPVQVPTGAETSAPVPITMITIVPPVPDAWLSRDDRLTIHYHLVDGGRLARVAKAELVLDDLDGPDGIGLLGALDPVPADVAPVELLLEDAREQGARVDAGVAIEADGRGRLIVTGREELPRPLRVPVKAYGNLVRLSRGETVGDEVLGSGDASAANQRFELRKQPLTYLADAAAPRGRRSTLEVRVDDLRWREADSFFGAGPEDRIYIVRHDDDGGTAITFGDGVHGARLPTGVDNLRATYRHGAGASKPPAGSITQLARPVTGIRRVVNPTPAWGGLDADRPKDLRRNAPASTLTLGRAVSIADFEAFARDYGAVNVRAEWAWDDRSQTAAVKVWVISDGASIAAPLEAFLVGVAGPGVPIAVAEALPAARALALDVEVEAGRDRGTVAREAIAALLDREAGLLARDNVPIGRPLFRSRLFAAVQAVSGVRAVRRATVDGAELATVIPVGPGAWLDAAAGLRINGAGAGGS